MWLKNGLGKVNNQKEKKYEGGASHAETNSGGTHLAFSTIFVCWISVDFSAKILGQSTNPLLQS